MARSSTQSEQLIEEGRHAGRSLMNREKSAGQRADPCETSRRTRNINFCDFVKPSKRTNEKGKIEPNEQSK